MKKFLSFCIVVITLFCFALNVYADGISLSMSSVSNIDEGDSFTVTVKASGTNIWGIRAKLNYESSKITLDSYSGLSGFNATVGSNIVLDSGSGHDGSFDIINLVFKSTSSFKAGESTTISLSSVEGGTDTTRLTGSDCSKTVTVNVPKSSVNTLSSLKINGTLVIGFDKNVIEYNLGKTNDSSIEISAVGEDSKATITGTGTKSLNYGTNSFDIVVKAENGSVKTYKIIISRNDNRSTNNYLSSLTIANASIKFNKTTGSYTVTVENKVTSITINAAAEDSKSSVKGTGSYNLKVYSNKYEIVVTAENGSTRKYTVTIIRKDEKGNSAALSTNNYLSSLSVTGYEIEFNKDTLEYSLTVEANVDKIDIKTTLADSKAKVIVSNVDPLKSGSNEIIITVTAENGTNRIYKVIVNKKLGNKVDITNLKDVIDTTTDKTIEVEIKDDNTLISKEIIDSLSGKDIELIINKYKGNEIDYIWYINAQSIENGFEFDTLVKFETNNMENIDKLTNNAKTKYLSFNYSGKLPAGSEFKVYVGDKFNDNEVLKLYYYDESNNTIKLESENIRVTGGYVRFGISHCSDYILINDIESSNNNILFIIIGAVVLIIALASYLIISKKRNKVGA